MSSFSFWIAFCFCLGTVFGAEDGQDACHPVSLLQSKVQLTQSVPVTEKRAGACLDVTSWHDKLNKQEPWHKISQGNQDSILASLFHKSHLGTTNKYYVEFGYQSGIASNFGGNWDQMKVGANGMVKDNSNTGLLKEGGWTGLRMDGEVKDSLAAKKENLHQEFITSENVASLFSKYGVPLEADYVSIDIDSCDLWVFLGLTKAYHPRALTVEYNSKYPLSESKTNVCKDSAGQPYSWNFDDMYGTSLMALHKAAEKMGYTVVAVESQLDAFLVRKDLVCPGTELPIEFFQNDTGVIFPEYRNGNATEMKRWVMDY